MTKWRPMGASPVLPLLIVAAMAGTAAAGAPSSATPHLAVLRAATPSGTPRVLAFEKPVGGATPHVLRETVQVLQDRLRHLGVVSSRVYTESGDIVIDVPRADAGVITIVSQTGELFFRPVDRQIALYRRAGHAARAPERGGAVHVAGSDAGALVSSDLCKASTASQATYPTTPPADDVRAATVVLPSYFPQTPYRYVLGPAEMTDGIVRAFHAVLNTANGQWEVDLSLTPAGSALFNRYAAAHYRCYERDPTDPPYCAQQALDLDGAVLSAPTIEAASYNGSAVISGGIIPFSSQQASDIALLLSYGPLPVRLRLQELETISPAYG